MAAYLLDADAVIDFLSGVPASVDLIRTLAAGGDALGVCDVVVAEVYSGLRPGERGRVGSLFGGLAYLATTAEAARQAGEWRYAFARQGVVLATSDVLVAATALAHRARIVTGNTGHYPMPEVSVVPLPRPRSQRGETR